MDALVGRAAASCRCCWFGTARTLGTLRLLTPADLPRAQLLVRPVAAVVNTAGRLLAHREFAATPAGYAQLTDWLTTHGQVQTVGVEGTGVYGAGLARHPTAAGLEWSDPRQADASLRVISCLILFSKSAGLKLSRLLCRRRVL